MKRLKLLPVLLLLLSLAGCIQEYTLTEEQNDSVAEYMAGKLLESDEDYDQDLIPEEDLAAETQDNTASEQVTSPGVSPTAAIGGPISQENGAKTSGSENQENYSLAEVIGAKDFEIQFTGYSVSEAYPEDTDSAYFSLTSREGNQLLVVAFDLKNTSDSKNNLNLSKSKILYQLDFNNGTVYKPSLTLLENDLQYIDITVAAGATKQVLLIFEIAKGTDLSNVNLNISKNDKTKIVELE